ncbi:MULTISPECIES: YfdX family protein [Burkholderia]|uniref:YfdX family protein n=1 Tax=Burkholderia cenocepacia TaxID=95486 RepID=A0A071MEC0_9BURK|nr:MULTISPECIES: YfdX family protein [Burkholderia]AKM03696.1 hypothetical protein ABD05_26785 [Burkholderia pyrrocinia]AOJ28874.1 hypothetical protein WJ12_29045 [Burkholderia seminalis]KVF52903.1 hypothetical protein WJ13_07540 [Burkholderia seminalis]MBJ9595225.1 YfdX family protein [Burkholderia seminalis]MBN3737666.1 YfdX family protein [Burkholderia sp. Tr-20355]
MSTLNRKKVAFCVMSVALLVCGTVPAGYAVAAVTQAKAVNQDFTKLSHAGNRAMIDVMIARSALFDGHPEAATHLLADAKTAMQAAKSDNSAFMKAESTLSDAAGAHANTATSNQATAWLPVGGDMTVLDDFTAQPVKAKAVANANAALKKGDREGAIKALKLADVNVAYTVDVVPLDQTAERIDQASALLNAGKYYEAGVVLHHVQDSQRFDQLDINAVPATRG